MGLLFSLGCTVHLILWLSTVFHSGRFACEEDGCWRLVVVELPISLAYIGGNASVVTAGSAVIGSLWWGVVVVVLFRFGKAARW